MKHIVKINRPARMGSQPLRRALGGLAGIVVVSLLAGPATRLAAAETEKFETYTEQVKGASSTVSFEMVPIPAGEIAVGSPEGEKGREKSDLAPRKVQLKPFWMSKYEVKWEMFLPWVFAERDEVEKNKADGVSHPSKPYGSVYRQRGEKGYPALGMSQLAADNFSKWLSKRTGKKYRLPTEDEWEYACRAGATTPYFWGEDPAKAGDYGWFKDNAEGTTQPLGKKKPNPFGVYDIVGNVTEWCALAGPDAAGVARGGAFSEEVTRLRSASRMVATDEWNELDPNSPPSTWWLSSADWAGIRLVRSFEGEDKPAIAAAAGVETKPAVAAAAGADLTKANYTKMCKGCHAETGKGDTKLGKSKGARDYTTAAVKATFNEAQWCKSVKEGIERDGTHIMVAYKEKLTDEEIKALVLYMKNL